MSQPLRPVSENLAGYVETLWAERPGVIWLTGWVRRDAGEEFAVVLADRRKYAGAVALACYERPDLPANAHAFVGLLQSDWQPGPETTDLFVFIGPELKQFIRSVSPLRQQDGPAFAAEFGRVQALCHAGRVNALRGALLNGQSWLPDTSALSGATVKAAADEILALPGFGCFVQGWLLSPTKRLVRLSVKLADRVLHSIPGGLYFLPRPDLGNAAPNMPGLLDRAGFVAVLTGPLQPEDLVAPVLKAWFSDGTSVNFSLDPMAVRRLGHATSYDAALRLFPALTSETFFEGCARAIRHEVIGRLAASQPLGRIVTAERTIIAVLPAHASDARLMVDQLAANLRGRTPAPAVALIAEQGAARAQLPLLADWVRHATGLPCATFTVEDAGRPFFALAGILDMLGATRFMFLGAGAFPNAAAWTQGLDILSGCDGELAVITAPQGATLAGMVWTTAAFKAHMADVGAPIGSTHAEGILRRRKRQAGTARITSAGGRLDQLLERVDAATMAEDRQS
ncbi:MAG: hypothetical protein EON47_02015 [Acetobacteraceae bacterium]|nr:MAG: hypothetical protein EON47_02015 [Acetobacteraceae bacterium]